MALRYRYIDYLVMIQFSYTVVVLVHDNTAFQINLQSPLIELKCRKVSEIHSQALKD